MPWAPLHAGLGMQRGRETSREAKPRENAGWQQQQMRMNKAGKFSKLSRFIPRGQDVSSTGAAAREYGVHAHTWRIQHPCIYIQDACRTNSAPL